jgi:hypothetical protein
MPKYYYNYRYSRLFFPHGIVHYRYTVYHPMLLSYFIIPYYYLMLSIDVFNPCYHHYRYHQQLQF